MRPRASAPTGRRRHGAACAAVLVLATSSAGCAGGGPRATPGPGCAPVHAGAPLSRAGRASLRSILDAPAHPDLDWGYLGAAREGARRLYASVRHGLVWSSGSGPTPQALALAELLRDADQRGLDPRDYDGPAWEGRLEALARPEPPAREAERARFDVALTVSALRFVSDLRFGRTPAGSAAGSQARAAEATCIVAQLIAAEDVRGAIERLEPGHPEYRRARAALVDYAKLAREDDGEPLQAVDPPPAPGEPYPGAARLARLLGTLRDLPQDAALDGAPERYEAPLVEAVMRFQRRHGLPPDGRLDARTLRALNVPLADRVTQLELVLERWRSLPRDGPPPTIVVNIPEFKLRAGAGEAGLSMNVVVGRAGKSETPAFASGLTQVEFRPYWNVPLGIQRREVVPLLARRGRRLLAEEEFEIVDRGGNVSNVGVSATTLKHLRTGSLRLRQRPGDRNALGRVKFTFADSDTFVLHGAPREAQFRRPRRDFSHGCIRVEDEVALAAWVLRDRPEWDLASIEEAAEGDRTVRLELDPPVPIVVFYGTASVAEDGEVRFFEDVYGRDEDLVRSLAGRRAAADRQARMAEPVRPAVRRQALVSSGITSLAGNAAPVLGLGLRAARSPTVALGASVHATSSDAPRGADAIRLGYVGIDAAWTSWRRSAVQVVLGALVGPAWARSVSDEVSRSTALILEPTALVEAALSSSIRVGAGASWRQAVCVRCSSELGARALSGPSSSVQLRIDRF